MKKLALLLLCVCSTFAVEPAKQAVIYFEMGNYFLQGQDWENAEKYYRKAEGKLPDMEMEVLLCRNLSTVFMMKERREETLKTLAACIEKADTEMIKTSKALTAVYKLYAEIIADRINPKILDKKRDILKQRVEQMKSRASKQKPQRPRLGFK